MGVPLDGRGLRAEAINDLRVVDIVYSLGYLRIVSNIIWDELKNEWLKVEHAVSFEEISGMIMDQRYRDIVKNPSRLGQFYFVMTLRDYTWLVPFFVNDQEQIVLKTAFPSRKYHKKYGGTP